MFFFTHDVEYTENVLEKKKQGINECLLIAIYLKRKFKSPGFM